MIGRIKKLIGSLSISERAFALACGIAQNTMNYYLSGKRKPSCEAINKILNSFPDLSAEWLMRGEGEMFKSEAADANSDRVIKLVDTIGTLQEAINAKSDTINALNERIRQLENQLKSK